MALRQSFIRDNMRMCTPAETLKSGLYIFVSLSYALISAGRAQKTSGSTCNVRLYEPFYTLRVYIELESLESAHRLIAVSRVPSLSSKLHSLSWRKLYTRIIKKGLRYIHGVGGVPVMTAHERFFSSP